MPTRTFTHIGVLGLALLMGAGALMSHARPIVEARDDTPPPPAMLTMATVDMARIYSLSGAPQELNEKAAQIEQVAQDHLNTVTGTRFLSIKDIQEYIDLIGKQQPTPVETARAAELKKLSEGRQSELDALNVKPQAQLTAPDKARMHELNDMSHIVDKVIPNLETGYQDDARERVQAFRHEQISKLRVLVGQVAKEKGIAHVFDVDALVYSATDLTPAVLQKLTKRTAK